MTGAVSARPSAKRPTSDAVPSLARQARTPHWQAVYPTFPPRAQRTLLPREGVRGIRPSGTQLRPSASIAVLFFASIFAEPRDRRGARSDSLQQVSSDLDPYASLQ